MADTSKPSWRRGSSEGRGGSAAGKGWQSRRVKTSQSAVSSHRAKLIALGLLVVGLATYFAVKVFFIPVKTPLLILSATAYSFPLPPNGFAQEDAQLLTRTNSDNIHAVDLSSANLKRDELLRHLDNLPKKGGGPDKNTVILYLSAHGAVNDQAEPCLLLTDASPVDAATWLKFSEIIERIKRQPNTQYVLLLDVNRIDHDWSLGIIHNGFTAQLQKMLTESPVPNLHVINSVSPGERGWGAPEAANSVFGFFVFQALWGASSSDNEITLGDLEEYISSNVSAWAAQNRGSQQTPCLITSLSTARNLRVAYRTGTSAATELPSGAPQRVAADWKSVQKFWSDFERQIQDRKLIRYEPLAVAQTQRLLMRMEMLLLSGAAYRKEFESLQTEVRTLLTETDPRLRLPADLKTFSFPLRAQIGSALPDDPNRAVVLKKWVEAQGKPQIKEGEPPLPQLNARDASILTWQFVRQLELPSRTQLHDALSFLDEAARRNTAPDWANDVSEILMLRMVDRYVDRPNATADFSNATRRYFQRIAAIRELAEQSAAPDDERIHHWIIPLVEAGDLGRRLAEDALFCDGVASMDELQLDSVFSSRFQFTSQYDASIRRSQQIGSAYTLRDEVWSGLAYLSEWLLRIDDSNRRNAIGGDGTLAAAVEYIDQVASKNHELAAALDEALTANRLDSTELPEIVKAQDSLWGKLRDSFTAHCQELKDRAGQNKQTLREIGEALRVPGPLLEADERDRLATKYQSILFAESSVKTSGLTAPKGDKSGSSATKAAPDPIESVKKYPAMSILARQRLPLLLNLRTPDELPSEETDSVARFAHLGSRLRRWLGDLGQAASDLEDVSNRRLEQATETAPNLRAGLSEADRLVRASAAMSSTKFPDPAQRLRRVDLHLEYLWHARRALDDFWGPPPASDGSGESYFATAADGYLASARKLENKPKSLIHGGVNLSQLLVERKSAIPGTRVEPQDVTTLGDTAAVEQQIHVEWDKSLPTAGVAALFLEGNVRNSQPELIPVLDRDSRPWRRETLPLGKSPSANVVHFVPAQKLTAEKTDQELTANLLFRGHLLRSPFSVRGSTPLLVSVNPRLPNHAKVTVKGEGDRRAFIVFIFDCSRSMEQDGRIVKAKEALRQVVDSLPKDEHYNVGLRAYGRRAGYNSDATEVYGPDGQDTDRDPNTDVELMVEVAPLDNNQHAAITGRFRELQPLGVTPLYLSIQDALLSDDFILARPDDLKHIIVITDGVNEQRDKVKSVADVLKTIRENPKAERVRVDVVLFQEESLRQDRGLLNRLQQRGTTLAGELRDVKSVATATGGEYFAAENPEQLVDVLRRTLKLVKYSVAQVGAPAVPEKRQLDLGKEWLLTNLPRNSQQYVVRLHGVSNPSEQVVTIEGGEALELHYDRSEDRLVFPPYVRGDARAPIDGLPDPRSDEQYRVLPILPRKDLQRVEFEVAIQNRNRLKFTPRPLHVWAEIQPLNEGEEAAGFNPYHFFDAEFAPDTPVPVFRFVVPNWPAGATKAGLQMAIKFETPPLETNGSALAEELKSVVIKEDIPQVSFRAEIKQFGEGGRGWRLTVWEEHEPGSKLFTARVQARPSPDQLRHQFFVGVDRVKHEFDYVDKPAPTVFVTARERIEQGAVTVSRVIMAVKD